MSLLRNIPVKTSASAEQVISHFWVCNDIVSECAILVSPGIRAGAIGSAPILLYVFDYLGELVNELKFEFPPGDVGVVELTHLMERCRPHRGYCFGQVVVQSSPEVGISLRAYTRNEAMQVAAPVGFNEDSAAFFPLQFANDLNNVLALVNTTKANAHVTVRLVLGSRTPEIQRELVPLSSEIVFLESEFSDYSDLMKDSFGYVRIRTRAAHQVGAQLVQVTSRVGVNDLSASWTS